jgi:ribosomal protein S12 methylthiotransferase accessory factor YcaO
MMPSIRVRTEIFHHPCFVVVVAVVAVVVVTAGFAAAVAFDVASIPALQELRGLNAWERHWRNQHKKAAAKVGRSNTGRGVADSAAVYHDTGGKAPPAACENCDGSCAHIRPPWVS